MTPEALFWIERDLYRGKPAVGIEFAGVRVLLSPDAALRIAQRIKQAAEALKKAEEGISSAENKEI